MNLKITLYTEHGDYRYCIISKNIDITTDMEKVFNIVKGYGLSIDVYYDKIKIIDYFHGDTRAVFRIIKQEETSENVVYHLVETED